MFSLTWYSKSQQNKTDYRYKDENQWLMKEVLGEQVPPQFVLQRIRPNAGQCEGRQVDAHFFLSRIVAHQALHPQIFQAEYGSGAIFLQIFPTPGLEPGSLHFRQMFYHLSQQKQLQVKPCSVPGRKIPEKGQVTHSLQYFLSFENLHDLQSRACDIDMIE